MKTTTLLLALATLGLASCSQDEPVVYNQSDAIAFRPAMGTRASEINNANLASFHVTGFLNNEVYINNVEYSKGTDGFFNSAHPYYWPGDDSPVDFYAYSPSAAELLPDVEDEWDDAEGSLVLTAAEKKLNNFRVADSIKNQVDFITAVGTGKRSVNESAGLELTFGHRLAQIEIQAKSSNPDFTFKVVGMRIGRAENKGTFDFTTNKWTPDDWHETAVYESHCPEITLTENAVSIMGPEGNAMLLPQTLTAWSPKNDPDNVAREAYLSVLVQISATDGGAIVYPFPSDTKIDPATGAKRTYAWASIPISGTWEAGMKYIYTLDFTHGAGFVDPDDPHPGTPILGNPIKFSVNVLQWQANSASPLQMPLK